MANDGKTYEQIVRAIYQQIVDNEGLGQRIEVKHDVEIVGTVTKHQIDVYWEFKFAEVRHRVIIQAKNWNKRVDKSEVLKLAAVRDDLPNSNAVIVTTIGYQDGALEAANKLGITLCLVNFETAKPALSVEAGSRFRVSIKGLLYADGQPCGFRMEALVPKFQVCEWKLQLDGDTDRLKEWPQDATLQIADSDINFCGSDRQKFGRISDLYAKFKSAAIADFLATGTETGEYKEVFEPPAVVGGPAFPVPTKLKAISVRSEVRGEVFSWDSPLNNVAVAIFENLTEGSGLRRFFVKEAMNS